MRPRVAIIMEEVASREMKVIRGINRIREAIETMTRNITNKIEASIRRDKTIKDILKDTSMMKGDQPKMTITQSLKLTLMQGRITSNTKVKKEIKIEAAM